MEKYNQIEVKYSLLKKKLKKQKEISEKYRLEVIELVDKNEIMQNHIQQKNKTNDT